MKYVFIRGHRGAFSVDLMVGLWGWVVVGSMPG